MDQNTETQIRELEAAGCEQIYRDHGISGTKSSRPELERTLNRLSKGVEVVVWKLDRLGRNTRRLLELLDDCKARGIKFRSLRDGIATNPSPHGRKADRQEVTATHPSAKQARVLKNRVSNQPTAARSLGQASPPSTATSEWNPGDDEAMYCYIPHATSITDMVWLVDVTVI